MSQADTPLPVQRLRVYECCLAYKKYDTRLIAHKNVSRWGGTLCTSWPDQNIRSLRSDAIPAVKDASVLRPKFPLLVIT